MTADPVEQAQEFVRLWREAEHHGEVDAVLGAQFWRAVRDYWDEGEPPFLEDWLAHWMAADNAAGSGQ